MRLRTAIGKLMVSAEAGAQKSPAIRGWLSRQAAGSSVFYDEWDYDMTIEWLTDEP